MDDATKKRCIALGQFMVKNRATVRACGQHFGISKTAVHKILRQNLQDADAHLAGQVAELLDYNRSVRHLRGGEATRQRYARLRGYANGAE